MEVLPATRLLRQCAVHSSFSSAITNLHISPSKKNSELINFAKATRNGDRIPAQEMFELFLSERQVTGDIVSKVSDVLWKQELMDVKDTEDDHETAEESGKVISKEKQSGFLKLSQTKEWVTGINKAPVNETASISEWKFDSEKRRKMGILEYEALKRELLIITAGIAVACSCYCFISFSPQVALSYGIGAASSCLYLRLLYYQVDNMSVQNLPEIFRAKKQKRNSPGSIQNNPLQSFLERTIRGSYLALSSPRIIVPALLFGLCAFSKDHFGENALQLTPAILGFFAYKGALLIQVYRDNEDLEISPSEYDENIWS